jgi:hypothetical protein
MNDREHRLRQRIDELSDQRDKALEREQRQRRRAAAWRDRAYKLKKQLELAKARLQRR